MAEAKKAEAKAAKVNEYGQTEKEYREAHGGRDPEPPSTLEVDEEHQAAKKAARWG